VDRSTGAVEINRGFGGNEFFGIKSPCLNNRIKYGGSLDFFSLRGKNIPVFFPNRLPAGGEPPLKREQKLCQLRDRQNRWNFLC
jgi:hypothetical protein